MTVSLAKLKRLVVEEILAEEPSFFIGVDSSVEGVVVPGHLTGVVSLQIGRVLPLPIPNLTIDDWGITATLSFGRVPFPCRVPWAAVIGFVTADKPVCTFWDTPATRQEETPPPVPGERRLRLVGR